jgi:hypothetical protein
VFIFAQRATAAKSADFNLFFTDSLSNSANRESALRHREHFRAARRDR